MQQIKNTIPRFNLCAKRWLMFCVLHSRTNAVPRDAEGGIKYIWFGLPLELSQNNFELHGHQQRTARIGNI